jgi:thymidine kinase
MFIEPIRHRSNGQIIETGWIEVICGSMFSGKTEELIRRLKRAQLAHQKVEIFKPIVDTRYHIENIVSHNHNSIRSTPVTDPREIVLRTADCEIVGIDEGQFFNENLIDACVFMANHGKRVIVAGLDMDFAGNPFGPMAALMSVAEYVTKVHAICMRCGSVASYSYRLVPSQEQFLLGETELYEARCRRCFVKGMEKNM